MEAASVPPPWSELPPELIGCVVTRLPSAADCARSRAVCRSWHSAIRHHGSPPLQPSPWVIYPDGAVFTSSDGCSLRRPTSFPDHVTCIGSTDGWLALDFVDDDENHSYLLHNHFSNTSVPLLELEPIIGNVPETFKMRKVLIRRSTPHDIVALMPNNRNYPIILIRPGKGVWLPRLKTTPFTRIIDVAFLGDKLYGITQVENLYCLDIAFDGEDKPMVTGVHRIITCNDDDVPQYWSDDDEDEDHNEDENDDNEADEDTDDDNDDDDTQNIDDTENDDGYVYDRNVLYDVIVSREDDDVPHEPKDSIYTTWHLVESRGKLLMVRRQLQSPYNEIEYTREVEVFEADMSAGTWVPVVGGLGGHALFISDLFCKSVPGGGEVEEDIIHFIDTRDTFYMRSETFSEPDWDFDYFLLVARYFSGEQPTWLFPPKVVI